MLSVVVHSAAGVDSTHAGHLWWLHVPSVGRGNRLGVCPVLHPTSATHRYHQGSHSQRPNLQGTVGSSDWSV